MCTSVPSCFSMLTPCGSCCREPLWKWDEGISRATLSRDTVDDTGSYQWTRVSGQQGPVGVSEDKLKWMLVASSFPW